MSTAREKARAVAGSLAEQDQERLRSYRFDSLATVPQANPVTLDNVTYTIKSEASWITDDANAVPACGTTAQKQSEYLRIVSTVTSNIVGSRIAPVRIESMVAPSVVYGQDHGTLAVRILDRAGVGVPLMTVNAKSDDGTILPAAQTNAQGCALFRSIPVGGYTVGVNTTGYISKAGKQLLETTTTVNPNYVNNVSLTYDRKVNMTVTVKTLEPGDTFSPSAGTAMLSQAHERLRPGGRPDDPADVQADRAGHVGHGVQLARPLPVLQLALQLLHGRLRLHEPDEGRAAHLLDVLHDDQHAGRGAGRSDGLPAAAGGRLPAGGEPAHRA